MKYIKPEIEKVEIMAKAPIAVCQMDEWDSETGRAQYLAEYQSEGLTYEECAEYCVPDDMPTQS